MPRKARIVFPNAPHHIIQRGNRNQIVFFEEDDKKLYLEILSYLCSRENLKVWCYCLMDNHVHLVVVPEDAMSLRRAIAETHKKYTYIINTRNKWKGHLWQGRFISYPMDEAYLYRCMRYIERNPVRAGLVALAEEYRWSSARAHVLNHEDSVLSPIPLAYRVEDWKNYLREPECQHDLKAFRQSNRSGMPVGSEAFKKRLKLNSV
ncbi:MAG: transposase [Candidatus Saccharicenans sp.]|uniref:transposase n=1 Tax=Candidatus Saccharicenans sp. TaxID=2819258 RepID=UPI00404B6AE3